MTSQGGLKSIGAKFAPWNDQDANEMQSKVDSAGSTTFLATNAMREEIQVRVVRVSVEWRSCPTTTHIEEVSLSMYSVASKLK